MSSTAFPGWYLNFQAAVLQQLPRPETYDGISRGGALAWVHRRQGELKQRLAVLAEDRHFRTFKQAGEMAPPPNDLLLNDLPPNLVHFSERVIEWSAGRVKSSGRTLNYSGPLEILEGGGLCSHGSMLRSFPGCGGLTNEELVAWMKMILPSFNELLGSVVQAIIQCEDGEGPLVSIPKSKVFRSYCVQGGEIVIFSVARFPGGSDAGWFVHCYNIKVGNADIEDVFNYSLLAI